MKIVGDDVIYRGSGSAGPGQTLEPLGEFAAWAVSVKAVGGARMQLVSGRGKARR